MKINLYSLCTNHYHQLNMLNQYSVDNPHIIMVNNPDCFRWRIRTQNTHVEQIKNFFIVCLNSLNHSIVQYQSDTGEQVVQGLLSLIEEFLVSTCLDICGERMDQQLPTGGRIDRLATVWAGIMGLPLHSTSHSLQPRQQHICYQMIYRRINN